jgi:hypothetical protein
LKRSNKIRIEKMRRLVFAASTSSCYPQNANLNENAAFQSEIIDVVFSAIMIWMHCSVRGWGQRIYG